MKVTRPKGSAVLIIIIVVAVVAIGVGLFFVLNRKNTTTAPSSSTTTPSTETSTGSPVTTNQIIIKDMAFSPDNVTVAKGATVTWSNNDGVTHTVTANDGSFNSGNLAAGKTFSKTFDTPGVYRYHCAIHPNMTGIVTVTQ